MIESDNDIPEHKTPVWWVILAPLLVMLGIFALSSRSQLPDLDRGLGLQSVAGHFTVYFALGFTLALLFRSLGWNGARTALVAIAIATLYGITDEFHQSFVPNRTPDPQDVMVDFLGATVGALLLLFLHRQRANYSSDIAPDPPVDGNS